MNPHMVREGLSRRVVPHSTGLWRARLQHQDPVQAGKNPHLDVARKRSTSSRINSLAENGMH